MFLRRVFLTTLVFVGLAANAEGLKVHYKIDNKNPTTSKIVVNVEAQTSSNISNISTKKVGHKLRSLPYYIAHDEHDLDYSYEEWEYSSLESAPTAVKNFVSKRSILAETPALDNSEMRIIRQQGSSDNRIDLTILGDGYTLAEKEKFFEDVEWTVKGLFETATFASYLPLFNVYAVFVPSTDSGIGDGSPKNTAFKLYRNPRGSKRGIMPGDEWALSQAVRMAPATDYPIVLANDDYYGGLGGRWAISTRSRISGLKVLRHELGHNFGEVGEEYDNGYVYSGANSSGSSRVSWTQWLDDPKRVDVHEAQLLSGDYVWQDLGRSSYTRNFTLPSNTQTLDFDLSSVGWSTPNDVHVELDGELQALEGHFHADRSFFNFSKSNFAPGSQHTINIKENINDGDNVLGFALAYAMPASYDFTLNKVGAFATYDTYGRKSYRPTHKSCIMKDMELEHFCAIDQENMWIKFLEEVSLIDSLSSTAPEIVLSTQNIDDLSIQWFKKQGSAWTELENLRGLKRIASASLESGAAYKVVVKLDTPEVRKELRIFEKSVDFRAP